MKTTLITGITFIAISLTVYVIVKKVIKKKKLKTIAEEGYETAIDIIAPSESFKNLKYGPTLPA